MKDTALHFYLALEKSLTEVLIQQPVVHHWGMSSYAQFELNQDLLIAVVQQVAKKIGVTDLSAVSNGTSDYENFTTKSLNFTDPTGHWCWISCKPTEILLLRS